MRESLRAAVWMDMDNVKEGDVDRIDDTYATGVPLQTTEDHLGRLLGREGADRDDSTELTWQQERDVAVDEDDEALLAEKEVDNAEDDVVDADNDDAIRSNNLTPIQLSDSTRLSDLLDSDNEAPEREGHVISPDDFA